MDVKRKKQEIFFDILKGHIITGLFGGAIFEGYEGDAIRQKLFVPLDVFGRAL